MLCGDGQAIQGLGQGLRLLQCEVLDPLSHVILLIPPALLSLAPLVLPSCSRTALSLGVFSPLTQSLFPFSCLAASFLILLGSGSTSPFVTTFPPKRVHRC